MSCFCAFFIRTSSSFFWKKIFVFFQWQVITFIDCGSNITPRNGLALVFVNSVGATANFILNGGHQVAIVGVRSSEKGTMTYIDIMMQT